MVLCKNYRYFRKFSKLCKHREARYSIQDTLVYGHYNYRKASEMRNWITIYGKNAKYFEPKVNIWKIIFKRNTS